MDPTAYYCERAENEDARLVECVDVEQISKCLEPLNSADSKLLVVYLIIVPNAEPEEIKEALDTKLLTILPLLSKLHERGLIKREENGRYACQL